MRSNRTRPITPLPPGANKIPFWLSMISSVTVGCCGVVTRVPARAENHAPVGLTQTCCRLQERVEDFRQIECRLMELAGDIRDGRGDASHRQLLKDIENANVLTGGCVCRSLPHYTVHATEQMIRRNVRQNTEPFSTWGNSGLVEPHSGSGNQLSRYRRGPPRRPPGIDSKVTLSDHAAYSRRAASYHQRCCIG